MCHVSCVMCHLSPFTCKKNYTFLIIKKMILGEKWTGWWQTWNWSQASQACLCNVFGTQVKFYLEHTLFLLRFVRVCVQDLDTLSHCLLHTTHITLLTVHYTYHTGYCTLHISNCLLHTKHVTLVTTHYTYHTAYCTLHIPHCLMHTTQITLLTAHYTYHTVYCTQHILLFTGN